MTICKIYDFEYVTYARTQFVKAWKGWTGLPFWLKASSSEATTCITQIQWVWAIRNQWLWALLFPPMLCLGRERLKQCKSTQDSLAQWAFDGAWIGWLDEVGEVFLVEIVGLAVWKNREVKNASGI